MPSGMSSTTGLLFGAGGIYAAFLYYGALQEDVFSYQASDGSKFTQAWFLQTVEALANVLVGAAGMALTGRTAGLPLGLFAVSGATQVIAKVCTSMSLAAGLSFPVATLAKSAKMAPVMLGGFLLGGKKYSIRECLQVIAIIAGTMIVSMKKSKPGASSSILGVIYLCSSLALDGCTGGIQDRLKKSCTEKGVKAKPYEFMFWTNLFMMLVALVVAAGSGELASGIAFLIANPEILQKILLFSACSAVGQSFIFFTIATFGPLKVATVTTTRKIFSVLLSIFLKGHPMTPLQWSGVVLGSIGIAGELMPKAEKKEVEAEKEKKRS